MSELTQRLRAKFPGVYDDLSDADLEKAVLAKHPEYADLASKTEPPPAKPAMADAPTTEQLRSQMFRNAGKDVVDTLGGIPDALAQVVQHPIDSLTAIPAGMLHRVAAAVRDPIGAMYEHPVGTPLDVAGVLSGVKAVAGAAEAPGAIRAANLRRRVDRYMPNRSQAAHAMPVSPENAALPLSTGVDRYMPNQGAASHAPDPFAGADHAAPPIVERYLPNQSAASHAPDANAPGAVVRDELPESLRASPSAFVNVDEANGAQGRWHAYGSDAERNAADAAERAQAHALHREVADLDSRYRYQIDNPRGAASIGLLMNIPKLLQSMADGAISKVGQNVMSTIRPVARYAPDTALITREGLPQQAPDDSLRAMLLRMIGGQ